MCSLGTDSSVRITYHPILRFRETQGLLQKSVLLHFHQAIEIKNTKTIPIRVRPWRAAGPKLHPPHGNYALHNILCRSAGAFRQMVVEDPFPESAEEKIKVTMIEPDPRRLKAATSSVAVLTSMPASGAYVHGAIALAEKAVVDRGG